MTRTPFFPMLDNGLSFLDLIFAYISFLNLVVISTRRKHLLKKKKIQVYVRGSILTSSIFTLFSFNINATQDVGRQVKTKIIEGKCLWIYQVVPTFDCQDVFYYLLNACLMPAFKLRPSLHCTKQKEKESVTITKNTTKLKMTGRNTDALKVGVPH